MTISPVEWGTADGQRLALELLTRLKSGHSVRDLGLPDHDGRLDVRGLALPPAVAQSAGSFADWDLTVLAGPHEFRGCTLDRLDLSGATLPNLRLFSCRIHDCCLEAARLPDLRVWGLDVEETSFRSADLRGGSLGGGVYEGRWSRYRQVDFTRADLRGASVTDAEFLDCDFTRARLDKVEFAAALTRCRFAGTLREVLFYARSFESQKPTSNSMEDVDFTEATLRWVGFRGLDLDRVRFPNDADHIVIHRFPCVLEALLSQLQDDDSARSRAFAAVVRDYLKWLGPKQQIGLFHRRDLAELEQTEHPVWALALLSGAEASCAEP